jgi:hypothetical protein
VDQLLQDKEQDRTNLSKPTKHRRPSQELDSNGKPRKKRKSEDTPGGPKPKKIKTGEVPLVPKTSKITLTLKLGPKPAAPDPFPCCLCVNMSKEGLLRVQDPPTERRDTAVDELPGSSKGPKEWMAHEDCANVVPETWVDQIDVGEPREDGTRTKEKVVFGVDGIVKDRWNLVRLISEYQSHQRVYVVFLEMLFMHEESLQGTRSTRSMHQRQMSESFPRHLCS